VIDFLQADDGNDALDLCYRVGGSSGLPDVTSHSLASLDYKHHSERVAAESPNALTVSSYVGGSRWRCRRLAREKDLIRQLTSLDRRSGSSSSFRVLARILSPFVVVGSLAPIRNHAFIQKDDPNAHDAVRFGGIALYRPTSEN
jgi:hypothetical protein